MLQSWFYGEAKKNAENIEVVRFVISDSQNPIAIVQILLKKILFFITIARINRGPILVGTIKEENKNKLLIESIKTIILYCKKQSWRMLQIAPELSLNKESENLLKDMGFRKLSLAPWTSGLINLSYSNENLMMSFKSKWRNCLKKGLKLGVNVSLSNNNKNDINKVISNYKKLQLEKNFIGLSENLIIQMVKQNDKIWKFNIYLANVAKKNNQIDKEEIIGMLVSIEHGDTATYLLGMTNAKGREYQANYVLLWQAILNAKKNGCKWFDIGGLNTSTPKGIVHFKEGIKSDLYRLVGEWRSFIIRKM